MTPRLLVPVLVALPAVLIHGLPQLGTWLEYRREALVDLELWRLVTGHWTHGSFEHFLWDTLAFVALGCGLCALSPRAFRNTVLGSVAAISAFLLVYGERWEVYRGLSGIDTALFVALAGVLSLDGQGKQRWIFPVALLLAAGKIGWEAVTGTALFAADIPGHAVVPLAHGVGAAVGLLAALDYGPAPSVEGGARLGPPRVCSGAS